MGCNTTKHVVDGEFLLKSNVIVVENTDYKIDKGQVESLLKQKPNHLIGGFIPFHLSIYNLVDPQKEDLREQERSRRVKLQLEKEDKFYFTRWLREIGERPVIWDKYKTKETDSQIRQYLKNKGYYDAVVTSSVAFADKKCKVTYKIVPGVPTLIKKVDYKIDDSTLVPILDRYERGSLIKVGSLFDVDVLQSERERIEGAFKRRGYYNFSKEYIYFLADTTVEPYCVNLTMGLKNYERQVGGVTRVSPHKRYVVDSVFIYTNYDPKRAWVERDTYFSHFERHDQAGSKFVFFTDGAFKIRPQTILRENFIVPDSIYNLARVRKTYRYLSLLPAIKLTNIKFEEKDTSSNLLNCNIFLTPHIRQAYTAELEGSNASGNWGVAGNLTYTNRNIFRGGEIFDFKIRGARETMTGSSTVRRFNTTEVGFESNIRFQKFVFPFVSEEFSRGRNLKTNFSLVYSYQTRPDYNRIIANMKFGYYWKNPDNDFVKYTLYPLDLNMVELAKADSFNVNLLKYSYQNHLILGSSFSFVYDNMDIRRLQNHWYLRVNYESAGNFLKLIGRKYAFAENADGLYTAFEHVFAQYQRFDADFRYYYKLAKNDWVVTRLFFGVGIPYGNSKNGLPFIKQFYTGGATSIRAWKVRSLGPGSYSDPYDTYYNQSGDVKIEANIEYRFKMFWVIEGAAFFDVGNVWSITKTDEREGAKFNYNRFYNEIAMGTGLGFRFDFSFFIIRFDFGLKIKDPAEPKGHRYVGFDRGYKLSDVCFNFGIGYPF